MNSDLILIVEDDVDVSQLMSLTLTEAGFRTLAVDDGELAVELALARPPAAVLLDIGLGPNSIDGLEVCRRIRDSSDVPVVFLTTRGDEIDELVGLTAGADDYLAKPISPRLLAARVAAVLRRFPDNSRSGNPEVLTDGALHIDLATRIVSVNGDPVNLTRTQFDLLAALAEQPGRVVTREQLVDRVWGEWFGVDHHLDVHLSRLRAKILDAGGPRVAHVVRGVGFKLRA